LRSCGLDISTCTGLALVGEGEDRGKTIHLPRERGFLRLQLIADEVAETLLVWQPELVVVEGYAYCVNLGSFITLVEVGTVIRLVLYRLKLPWVEVVPSVLKKWITGRGNAKKSEMAEAVRLRWGYASKSEDIIDAFALAQMGQLGVVEVLKIKGVVAGVIPLTNTPSLS
jgi:crossover junction endodeoxyribonuclease RuvC